MTALVAARDAAVRENSTPTLPHVVAALYAPSHPIPGSTQEELRRYGNDVAHGLARLVGGDLAGMFDGPSTTRFDPSLPMFTVDLARVQRHDLLIALVMTCASAWMEAALSDPDAGQRVIVYDEAWRLVKAPALLARMQSQWKLARHLGIANIMAIHRLSDLSAVGDADSEARNIARGLLSDCYTKVIYNQPVAEARITGAEFGLSAAEVQQIPDLDKGEALWRIGHRAFMVRHACTPAELQVFDTNRRMTS
jgi:type IV secretory pathway VirB4 component